MRNFTVVLTALALLPALGSIGPALAQDNENKISDCIPLPQVADSDIIDDETIHFHLKNGRTYEVRLSFECPSLKFDDSFYYSVSGLRLCSTDVITTRSGFTCPIENITLMEEEAQP
ncbi:MAG: hypothetical protein PVF65_11265 [Sphingomonadales bacterium]